ncbi:MAG: ABC transporter substrate-binding protein [Planctomycetota bacterium]
MSPLRILGWLVPLVAFAAIILSYGRGGDSPRRALTGEEVTLSADDREGYPRTARLPEGGSITLGVRPQRVLVANASILDSVMSIWPARRIVAIPEQALTWSKLARDLGAYSKHARFDRFAAEPILEFAPDLVVCTTNNTSETISALQDADVPVVRLPLPENLEEARRDLSLIANLLGVDEVAKEVLSDLDRRIDALVRESKDRSGMDAAFYVHDGSQGWTSGERTLVEDILRIAGLDNSASKAGHIGTVRLSFEQLLEMDPEILVVPSAAGEEDGSTARLLRTESDLATLRAVKSNRIVSLHPSLFSSSSIEIVTAAEELARAVDEMLASSGRDGR